MGLLKPAELTTAKLKMALMGFQGSGKTYTATGLAEHLFDAAFEKDHELLTFVALEAETGARRSELAALRFSDFAEKFKG
mgnify:CR=1 FL=1